MTIQPTTPHERSEYGENVVKVVHENLVTDEEESDLRQLSPDGAVVITSDDGYGKVAYVSNLSLDEKQTLECVIEGENGIREMIYAYRRWVAAHSYIYYEENTTVVPDSVWDKKAVQLAKMQETHPNVESWADEAFAGFDGKTGMNLPCTRKVKKLANEYLEDE